MKKIKVLIAVLAIISLNLVSTLSAERVNDFINMLTKESRETLNNKGEHFRNLGEIEREFYNLCTTLDKSNIKEPSVLIIGGAYGARAAGALSRTEKVRVFLNDLDERHFDGIKQWAMAKNFGNRLILVPGTFLNMHQSGELLKFFGAGPVKFSSILAANVFHHLTPEEFIKGLGFVSEYLSPGGHAFFMNSGKTCENTTIFSEQAAAIGLMALGKAIKEKGEEGLSLATTALGGAYTLNRYLNYAQKRQESILYSFNESNGIKFPGYISFNNETLNPHLLDFSGVTWGKSGRYFDTTPEDFKKWSETVGFSYHPMDSINIGAKISGVIEKEISFSEVGSYYSARLTKDVSPTGSQGHYSSNSAYQELINSARNIENALKQLHKGKKFEIKDRFPYFGITDLNTQECYPSGGAVPLTTPVQPDNNEGQRLWNEIFKNNLKVENRDEGVIKAAYVYGLHALKIGNNELAAAAFIMGADLKNQASLVMLNFMQEKGILPYKNPAS